MTRRDYELIAGALGKALAESRFEGPLEEQGARTAALTVCSALCHYPRFDSDLFITYVYACADARGREMAELLA